MSYYTERKIKNELYETYHNNFSYIERVINSCTTTDQLFNAIVWALNYLSQIEDYEVEARRSLCGSSVWSAVYDFMKLRREIIMEVYGKKFVEITKSHSK